MLASSSTARTTCEHVLDRVPGDFSTPISQLLKAKLGDGIYGACKPHCHDKAVSHVGVYVTSK